MKTTFRYLSLNAQATWHRQVEEQLKQMLWSNVQSSSTRDR